MREMRAAEREGGGGLAQEARRRLASVLAREFSKKVRHSVCLRFEGWFMVGRVQVSSLDPCT